MINQKDDNLFVYLQIFLRNGLNTAQGTEGDSDRVVGLLRFNHQDYLIQLKKLIHAMKFN